MIATGIYKIQSIVKPNRIYIGSSIDIKARWKCHLNQLKNNIHSSKKLQNHFNKYGKNDLMFYIITTCEKEELIEKEQYFIDVYNPWFNTSITAGSPMLGRHWSEEAKLKLIKAIKGLKRSDETRMNISLSKKGIKLTEEHKQNISQSLMGNKSHTGMTPWNKGMKGIYSEETIKKISEGAKSRSPISEETRQKMGESQKGRVHSAADREKIRQSNMRRHISKETRRKMSESQLKRFKLKMAS